jgi:hypothetical protein
MTKEELFNDIEEIKWDRLFITDSVDNVDEEVKNNCWSISINDEIVNQCTVVELKAFLKDVKTNRREQLSKSNVKVGLIYYLWVDEQAGQLRFNFVNSNHTKLPFRAPQIFTDKEDDILSDYLIRRRTDFKEVKIFKELITV